MKKTQTAVSHQIKNAPTSPKWLSLSEFQELASKLKSQLTQLALLPRTYPNARRFQSLLLVVMHVLTVPQRSQVYMQLRIGSTLLPVQHSLHLPSASPSPVTTAMSPFTVSGLLALPPAEVTSTAVEAVSHAASDSCLDSSSFEAATFSSSCSSSIEPSFSSGVPASVVSGSVASEEAALIDNEQGWRMWFNPQNIKALLIPLLEEEDVSTSSFNPRKMPAWKTDQPLEFDLPPTVSCFLSEFVRQWRPILMDQSVLQHDFLFTNPDGSAPLEDINGIVKCVTMELTGKETSAHLFRSISATHLFNHSKYAEELLPSLARCMNNSVDTVRKHYILPDRLEDARRVQSSLDRVLAVPTRASQIIEAETTSQPPTVRPFSAKESGSVRAHSSSGKRVRLEWNEQELDALSRGVAKHGEGAWTRILRDADLGPLLRQRTNADLKDRWRSSKRRKPFQQPDPK